MAENNPATSQPCIPRTSFLPRPSNDPIPVLSYSIHSYSGYSGNFRPSNITVDKPKDPNSRWSGTVKSAHDTSEQAAGVADPWIIIELSKPSDVRYITFGKHMEPHPCNITSITVLGGSDPRHLTEIYSGRLKNDTIPERKEVKRSLNMWDGRMEKVDAWEENARIENSWGYVPFAVKYIKLIPGPSYEPRFNRSLWHIRLEGYSDESRVAKIQRDFQRAQLLQANRVTLKHLRTHRQTAAYAALLAQLQTNPTLPPHILEHPLLTDFHTALVERGDYDEAEIIVQRIVEQGLMDRYISRLPVMYEWKVVGSKGKDRWDADGREVEPGRRGGHALCVDSRDGRVYMFGGWNGDKELDDFWVRTSPVDGDQDHPMGDTSGPSAWKKIERKTPESLWPPARSAHKMTIYEDTIYMMGYHGPRLPVAAPTTTTEEPADAPTAAPTFGMVPPELAAQVEHAQSVSAQNQSADPAGVFWAYDLKTEEWTSMGAETEGDSKPPAGSGLFALQANGEDVAMHCYPGDVGDDEPQIIQVFFYCLEHKRWNMGPADLVYSLGGPDIIVHDKLHRGIKTETDLTELNIRTIESLGAPETTNVTPMLLPVTGRPPPFKPGHATRGYFDDLHQEVVVIVGHKRGCILPIGDKTASIWRYNMALGEWFPIEDASNPKSKEEQEKAARDEADEELLRSKQKKREELGIQQCGHQLVYDPVRDVRFVVGSQTRPNTADEGNTYQLLKFDRPGRDRVRRKCLLAIRKQRFIEMVPLVPSMQALQYLQGPLHAVVDHTVYDESKHFRALLAHLLQYGTSGDDTAMSASLSPEGFPAASDEVYAGRTDVFESILHYISKQFKQPSGNLLHAAQDL